MKYLQIFLTLLICSCSNESYFIKKDHDVIKAEITANYEKNKQVFQLLAKEVAAFKIIRAIQFKYGRSGLDGINVYCDSVNRYAKGYSFVVQDLNDSRLQKVLREEGITKAIVESLKQRLDEINCNGFFTLRAPNINTGTHYIHTEFKYSDWNGVNFYFYKLFDKAIEPDMVRFFDRTQVVLGQRKNTGAVLDSNAVWYFLTD